MRQIISRILWVSNYLAIYTLVLVIPIGGAVGGGVGGFFLALIPAGLILFCIHGYPPLQEKYPALKNFYPQRLLLMFAYIFEEEEKTKKFYPFGAFEELEPMEDCVESLRNHYQIRRLESEELPPLQQHVDKLIGRPPGEKSTSITRGYEIHDGSHSCDYAAYQFNDWTSILQWQGTQWGQFVCFSIPFEIGRASIRPERLQDKVAEYFQRREIDLARYPRFSGRYCFQAKEPDRVERHFPDEVYELLADESEWIVEFLGPRMLISSTRPLDAEVSRRLIELALAVLQAVSR